MYLCNEFFERKLDIKYFYDHQQDDEFPMAETHQCSQFLKAAKTGRFVL